MIAASMGIALTPQKCSLTKCRWWLSYTTRMQHTCRTRKNKKPRKRSTPEIVTQIESFKEMLGAQHGTVMRRTVEHMIVYMIGW